LQWQHAIRVKLHQERFDLPIKVGCLLFAHAFSGTMTPGMQALDEVIDRLQERDWSRLLPPIPVKQATRL
jgi:hypothetical protein